ncbi:MAG: 23S rRNA (pseudouridine(1915)-N(3))-methyltransferase RlmH [Acidobacteriaceae bacterium]
MPAQSRGFATEPAFQAYLEGMRRYPVVALCEQRGKMLTSEELAAWIGRHRDAGAGSMILAIGPADGWSATAIKSADLTLAFGSMTLPHALARLVLAEQVYRAASILGGHPYHLGH